MISCKDKGIILYNNFDISWTILAGDWYVLHASIFHIRSNFSFFQSFYNRSNKFLYFILCFSNLLFFHPRCLPHWRNCYLCGGVSVIGDVWICLFHWSFYNSIIVQFILIERITRGPVWTWNNIFWEKYNRRLDMPKFRDQMFDLNRIGRFYVC